MTTTGAFTKPTGGKKYYKVDGDQLLQYKAGDLFCAGWKKVTYEDIEGMPSEEFDFVAGLVRKSSSSRV